MGIYFRSILLPVMRYLILMTLMMMMTECSLYDDLEMVDNEAEVRPESWRFLENYLLRNNDQKRSQQQKDFWSNIFNRNVNQEKRGSFHNNNYADAVFRGLG